MMDDWIIDDDLFETTKNVDRYQQLYEKSLISFKDNVQVFDKEVGNQL